MGAIGIGNARPRPSVPGGWGLGPSLPRRDSLSDCLVYAYWDWGLPTGRPERSAVEPEQLRVPRRAVLHLPNGQIWEGSICQGKEGTDFYAGSPLDVMLHERPGLKVKFLSAPNGSYSLDVKPDLASLPHPRVAEENKAILPVLFKAMAEVAGGGDCGMDISHRALHLDRLDIALQAIADRAEDPYSVQLAIEGLRNGAEFHMALRSDGKDYRPENPLIDAHPDFERVYDLDLDEHIYVSIEQNDGERGHALAIDVTRLDDRVVRLGIFNSNGWRGALDGREGNVASRPSAVFKTMAIDEAVEALKSLQEGQILLESANENERMMWHFTGAGAPLIAWLRQAGNPAAELQWKESAPVIPRESGDSSLEVAFSWLANVVSRADYKLAKAHVLNAYAEDAESLGVESRYSERIKDRLSLSLAGYLKHLEHPAVTSGWVMDDGREIINDDAFKDIIRLLRDHAGQAAELLAELELEGVGLQCCCDRNGGTILHHLMASDLASWHPEEAKALVDALVGHGLDVNARDVFQITPLHACAADPELTAQLIRHGADVNAVMHGGITPLFVAADARSLDLLLDHGADIRHVSDDGEHALEFAVAHYSLGFYMFPRLIEAGLTVDRECRERLKAKVAPERHGKIPPLGADQAAWIKFFELEAPLHRHGG